MGAGNKSPDVLVAASQAPDKSLLLSKFTLLRQRYASQSYLYIVTGGGVSG